VQRLVSQHRAPCEWLRSLQADFGEQGMLLKSMAACGLKQSQGHDSTESILGTRRM